MSPFTSLLIAYTVIICVASEPLLAGGQELGSKVLETSLPAGRQVFYPLNYGTSFPEMIKKATPDNYFRTAKVGFSPNVKTRIVLFLKELNPAIALTAILKP